MLVYNSFVFPVVQTNRNAKLFLTQNWDCTAVALRPMQNMEFLILPAFISFTIKPKLIG